MSEQPSPGPDERARERYERDTVEHEMTVIRDDGVYRHLRIQKPGTWTYGHDLVTWPGYLAITGDAGEYMFSRIDDMFQFFSGDQINPHYWSQKLCGPGRGDVARVYSERAFRACVAQWLEDIDRTGDAALATAVDRDVLRFACNEHEAREALASFRHDDGTTIDSWEWDLREYDSQFLWCCWAILRGIASYRALVPAGALRAA
jgi:hypothetical protein